MAAYARRTLATTICNIPRRSSASSAHLLAASSADDQRHHAPPSYRLELSSGRVVPKISHSSPSVLLGLRSPLPFGLRYYSSSPSPTPESPSETVFLDSSVEVLSDTAVAAASALAAVPQPYPGEVAAAAAGSFPLVAGLQHLIDAVHSFTGLQWWASIVLTTILIRSATIPLLINQLKSSIKLSALKPEMEALQAEIRMTMDPQTMQEGQKKVQELFKKHGVSPFSPLKGLFIQGPVFVSFYLAISNMTEKVPSFKGGGTLWFTDLTTPDSMYIFPVLTSLSFLATVELNMQEGMEGNPMTKIMKNFSRLLAVLTIPFTASFPKAIFCYWVTSNIFSLVYGFVLRRPAVKELLRLPSMVPPPSPSPEVGFSLGGPQLSTPMLHSAPTDNDTLKSKSGEKSVASRAALSHRIRNLEKTVRSRSKSKKR